jgi:hypothetical protein
MATFLLDFNALYNNQAIVPREVVFRFKLCFSRPSAATTRLNGEKKML